MQTTSFPSLDAVGQVDLETVRKRGLLIFGYGSFAHDLAAAAQKNGLPVLGFVVSGPPPAARSGLPVWQISQLPEAYKDKPLWVGVYNHLAHSDYALIDQTCRAAGFAAQFPQHYFEVVADALGWRYWLTPRADYAAHAPELRAAFDQLHDEPSRQAMAQTLAFRLGQTLAAPLPDAEVTHYFPDFAVTACRARERGAQVFLDGGAYNGDTLEAALNQLPFQQVYAFEPDRGNYEHLTQRTRQLGLSAVNYPCGLSGRNEQLRFSTGQGEASAVKEDGDSIIQVVRLDDCLQNVTIDYLKLDVEGQEIPTLQGGRDLILKNRPILAIAAYHRWDDMWRIPAFVAELPLNYRLAYRSHSRNSFDGVFYAY